MTFDEIEELKEVIEEFEDETGLDRSEFVVVVHPMCPYTKTKKGNRIKMIAGVEVVTNISMYITAVSLVARYHLDHLDELIHEMGLDEPWEDDETMATDSNGPDVIIEVNNPYEEEERQAIQTVACKQCAHPISVLNSRDYTAATCPWCHQDTEIE